MSLGDAQNFVYLMTAKALEKRKLQRVEPKLGGAVVALDVDVRWLESVGHVEEEAISVLAKNGWHAGIATGYFFPISGLSSLGCAVASTSPAREVPRTKESVAERHRPTPSHRDACRRRK